MTRSILPYRNIVPGLFPGTMPLIGIGLISRDAYGSCIRWLRIPNPDTAPPECVRLFQEGALLAVFCKAHQNLRSLRAGCRSAGRQNDNTVSSRADNEFAADCPLQRFRRPRGNLAGIRERR